MFGAGEFLLETLQDKQVKKGVTREEKSKQDLHCLQSEIKIKKGNYMDRYVDIFAYNMKGRQGCDFP